MTARVSMLLKSRASVTCFRACFFPGRAKNLSAPRYNHTQHTRSIHVYVYNMTLKNKNKQYRDIQVATINKHSEQFCCNNQSTSNHIHLPQRRRKFSVLQQAVCIPLTPTVSSVTNKGRNCRLTPAAAISSGHTRHVMTSLLYSKTSNGVVQRLSRDNTY